MLLKSSALRAYLLIQFGFVKRHGSLDTVSSDHQSHHLSIILDVKHSHARVHGIAGIREKLKFVSTFATLNLIFYWSGDVQAAKIQAKFLRFSFQLNLSSRDLVIVPSRLAYPRREIM